MIDEKKMIHRVIEELRRQGDNKLADEVEKPKGFAFQISPEDRTKFENWDESHKADKHSGKEPYSGAIGGRLTFSFTSTSIGQIQKVKCGLCGEEMDLTNYGEW